MHVKSRSRPYTFFGQTQSLCELEPDLVQISGGEPTLHPQILEIIRLLMDSPVRHLMLYTNGIRIAREPEFVAELARHRRGFEVYLQFDSMRPHVLREIRGVDATASRIAALENLEAHGISTTLVCTVKRSCVHFVTPDGKIYPFDTYNLLYRDRALTTPTAASRNRPSPAPGG